MRVTRRTRLQDTNMPGPRFERSLSNNLAMRLRWLWNETKRAGREYHLRLLEGFRAR